MNLRLLDKSNYLKGLLVLLRRDRIIDAREREFLLEVGKILDFDRRFCEATIDELLRNSHVTREPVIFNDCRIGECFIRDALRLAMVDGRLHSTELRWLRAVARANNRSNQWLNSIIRGLKKDGKSQNLSAPLEIQRYLESGAENLPLS